MSETRATYAGAAPRVRIGDSATLAVTVLRLWTDADAARKAGDDGHRCDVVTSSGKRFTNVPVADLEGGDMVT